MKTGEYFLLDSGRIFVIIYEGQREKPEGKEMRIRAMRVPALRARLRTALLQAVFLAALGVVCGVAFNAFRYGGLAWVGDRPPADAASARMKESRTIRIDEAWKKYQQGQALFVDARGPSEYLSAHLPGAVNVPVERAEKSIEQLKRAADSGRELVVYCSGSGCSLSSELASVLLDKGIRNVSILPEGWSGWLDAGFPIEEGDAE